MELGENLNSQFAKEKTDLETEITSKLNEQHSEEVNSVKEQWKNKYTELKQKVGTTKQTEHLLLKCFWFESLWGLTRYILIAILNSSAWRSALKKYCLELNFSVMD